MASTCAFRAALLTAIAAAVVGCGQTGSLYLPDEAVESPVEIRDRAPPSPAPPPSTAVPSTQDEEKDEKTTEPPGR